MHFGFLRAGLLAQRLCGASCAALAGTATAHAAQMLDTSIPAAVAEHAAMLAGKPQPGQVLHLVVSLPLRNTAALDQLLADIYNPASPNFRHYLSVADFTARFGPRRRITPPR